MSKLDELREYVSKLFEAATDKAAIENAAVVSSKIDEIEAEQKASKDDYEKLLKDYKDVVLHSSFKPLNREDKGADSPSVPFFDSNKAFEEAIAGQLKQSKGE